MNGVSSFLNFSLVASVSLVSPFVFAQNMDTHHVEPISQFLSEMQKSGKLEQVKPLINSGLNNFIKDSNLRDQISAQVMAYIDAGNFKALDSYPKISLKDVNSLRSLFSSMNSSESPATPLDYKPIHGDLEDHLGSCDSKIPEPTPVSAQVTELTYGHFTNPNLSACEVDRSIKMAGILNSLSVPGSSLTFRGQVVHSASELIRAFLLNDKNSVTISDQRVYANFLSYNWGDTEIMWPGWLDTGVALSNKQELTVPMGHSQYVWEISVPSNEGEFKASVSYFLGMSGTGFFPNVEMRPNWTGHKVVNQMTDTDGIIQSTKWAEVYLQRIIHEGKTVVPEDSMPALGYGFLGVCNDSIAVLEKKADVKNVVLPFPLLRAAIIEKQEAPLNDKLDDVLASLPKDGDQAANPSDILQRVLGMVPFDDLTQTGQISSDFRALMFQAQQDSKNLSLFAP